MVYLVFDKHQLLTALKFTFDLTLFQRFDLLGTRIPLLHSLKFSGTAILSCIHVDINTQNITSKMVFRERDSSGAYCVPAGKEVKRRELNTHDGQVRPHF